jgi:HK97 family phage prohead protease
MKKEKRAGRVLSSKNEKRLREVVTIVSEVLEQLGEPDPEQNSDRHNLPGFESRTSILDKLEIREEGVNEEGEKVPTLIRGHAAVFNELSVFLFGFREMIMPGAFTESIKDGDIRALWQHDSSRVLGRTKSGTLRLWEDDRGLAFELEPPNTSDGLDAVELIKRGDVDQMSFGFNVLPGGDKWIEGEDGMPIRQLHQISLGEISPVTWAAYPQTGVSVVRSAPDWVQRTLFPNGVDGEVELEARARLNEYFANKNKILEYLLS